MATDSPDHSNPYRSPTASVDEQASSTDRALPIRLHRGKVLLGLIFVGPVFGVGVTVALIGFVFVTRFFGINVIGPPSVQGIFSLAFLSTMIAVYSVIGWVVSLLAIPWLLLMNGRGGLGPRAAFGVFATLGTAGFLVLSYFGQSIGLNNVPGLGERATATLVFGCVFWGPSLVAAMAYNKWIGWVRSGELDRLFDAMGDSVFS